MSVGVDSADLTGLLAAWGGGDGSALGRLMPLVVAELHRLARRALRGERSDHVLQAAGLVNEAYLRLAGQRSVRFQNRAHFFAIAARIMRRVLVDHAREKACAKRGAGRTFELHEASTAAGERPRALVALDDALGALARADERRSRVVEMRYFGGFSVEEIAGVLGVHPDTVTRECRRARLFLRREIEGG